MGDKTLRMGTKIYAFFYGFWGYKVMHRRKCFLKKHLFPLLLCFALVLSFLPIEAFAGRIAFMISNNEEGYTVSYPDETDDELFATFAEALAACKEKDATPYILLGDGDPLELDSASAQDAANRLISGTYSGSVVFTYVTGGDAGFVVPTGAEVTFSGLTISNVEAEQSVVFTPVVAERGAALELNDTDISALFSDATNNSVIENSGMLNMYSGTVSGGSSASTGIRNNAGGTLHVSGGTVSTEAGYYATGILNYGLLTISDSANISASSCGIFAGGNASASVTISGGTVSATEDRQEGAVYLPELSQAAVTVSGGTLQSANELTLMLARGTAPGAAISLYGLTLHRSSAANLVVTGTDVDTAKTINTANVGNSLITAMDLANGHTFAAWTCDSAGETSLSAENPATAEQLSADSNEQLYLNTLFCDEDEPWISDGTAVRTGDMQGTFSFTTNEAGTYYYKAVPYGDPQPVIDPAVPDSYDGAGQTAAAWQVTTVSSVILSSGLQDIYVSVMDAAGNLTRPMQLTFLPFGVSLRGRGQTDNPYLIGTADELMLFASGVYDLGSTYALTADIDMTGRVWKPVGAASDQSTEEYTGQKFYGCLIGNNYTISNLEISGGESDNYQGLFAWIEDWAEVKDLNLTNVSVTGKNYVGALAGYNNGSVTNCSVGGQVSASGEFVGGLVGQQAGGIVNGCSSLCLVRGNNFAGGMFGLLSGGTLSRCSFLNAVMTNGGVAGGFAGKIAPNNANISVQNCYSMGTVSGSSGTGVLGGFVGQIVSSDFLIPSFTNCYTSSSVDDGGTMYAFYGALTGSASMTSCYYVSGVPGQLSHDGLTGLTSSQMADSANFTGWDFTDVWTISIGQPALREPMKSLLALVAPGSECGTTKVDTYWKADSFAVRIGDGDGAPESGALPDDAVSYQNGENLSVTDEQLNQNLTIYALSDEGAVTAYSTHSLCAEHVSIFDGGDGSAGNPYRISTASQLAAMGDYSSYDSPRHYILLTDIDLEGFEGSSPERRSIDTDSGWVPVRFYGTFDGNGKTIRNLTINRPDTNRIGLFTRLDKATVKNLAIVNASVIGGDNVGILTGSSYEVHIEKVSVSGSVSGRGVVGGLAGRLGSSPKTILDCFSTASVSGGGVVGGLVGHLEMSAIKNSYAAGTLTQTDPYIEYSDSSNRIRYSDNMGGLLGRNVSDSYSVNVFTSNYYDAAVSGLNDETGAAGKTTAQMKAQSTFAGWDFTSVWGISPSVNSGYPYLRSLYTPPAPPPVSDDPSPTPTPGVPVIVNGVSQNAGISSQTSDGLGRTVTTVTVDTNRLDTILRQQGENATVVIPVTGGADVARGVLTGQMVSTMEQQSATLVVQTGNATYTLPAAQINIASVSDQLGQDISLSDITVQISISEPPEDMVRVVEESAGAGGFAIMVPPVEFTISCTHGERTVDVTSFNAYVDRLIAVPDGVDPNQITTGIVVQADGTVRHIPTQIILIDGRYYAKINSLTNSIYSVIYNPVEFKDVTNHWAKDAINDMGSRMVLTGIGNGIYEPERLITRAEFAAAIVRALGLSKGAAESGFEDVTLEDWFNGYVEMATAYGLITGYDTNFYGPNDAITREQAFAILARAMKMTGLAVTLTDAEVSALLSGYTDGEDVFAYARKSAAACLKSGIITGTTATTISPKASVTRGEVAVMVQRLLQKSGLI